jgi:hypothetical protein
MFDENFDDTGAGSRTRRESGYPFWGISTQSVQMRRIDFEPVEPHPSTLTTPFQSIERHLDSENQPPITLMVAPTKSHKRGRQSARSQQSRRDAAQSTVGDSCTISLSVRRLIGSFLSGWCRQLWHNQCLGTKFLRASPYC